MFYTMEKLKKKNWIKVVILLLIAVFFFAFIRKEEPNRQENPPVPASFEAVTQENSESVTEKSEQITVKEGESYSDAEHVALYLHEYGHLPSNYITKTQAKKKGWIQEKGNLWDVLPGMSIGGGPYTNAEGSLPEKNGREYKECDINYKGGSRGGERIVYSNDGLIYYTKDHYNTFTLLYGEP